MPQVTVYIRQDDLDQWKSIEKKSEFIHDALIMAKLPPEVLKTRTAPTQSTTLKEPIKQTEKLTPALAQVKTTENPTPEGQVITVPFASKQKEVPKFPPSAASDLDIIKTPEDVKKKLYPEIAPKFIDKKYSARKKGSKKRHIDL